MSAGHQSVPPARPGSPEHDAHSALLEQLLSSPPFVAAVKAYTKEDESFDIPFLAGSNNAGDTIYFDHRFNQAVEAGEVKYGGAPYDPRPFVRLHEAVEGAAIRTLGANYDTDNAQHLPGGHLIATWAERRAVQHAGLDWDKYEASLKPWIRRAEHEDAANPPPDLLTVPYKGTPQDKEVERGAQDPDHDGNVHMGKLDADDRNRMASSTFGLPERRAYPMPDRSHAANAKARATQQYNAGNLSAADRAKIDRKADAKLKGSPGGYVANPAQNAAIHASERGRQGGGMAPRDHALTMASATHLHKAGYIGLEMKNHIHAHARMGLAKAKRAGPIAPFGSLAPMGEEPR